MKKPQGRKASGGNNKGKWAKMDDGSTEYVTRPIPLTAEQQAQKAELDSIMKESLAEIQKLSASDYSNDEATQRVLEQWSQQQEKLLKQQVQARTESEEQALAKRGLSDSSAAAGVRRQRLLDTQDAETNLNQQKDEISSQVRGEKLALQQNLYNIASSQTNAATARLQQAATKGQSDMVALNAQRQASLLDYYNAQLRASQGVFDTSLANGLGGSLGRTAGGGGIFGTMLGSLFGGR